ncbi:hypothetical protein [Fimbriiglobus ruber]|uniref:Uncharacterized protein n=1 Tax=Fimbriiglobus ruber TaxID=1908690 RepID=A0A225E0E5_9BACT|nr:hypothetical protein [Fimbriiglobus ruber]OWK43476.1 hypothetical protein FRUB_03075 [Fimbriiglobus ruber]
MDRARANGRITRVENGHLKRKQRANRDKRFTELVGKGQFPYTPAVQSWLSEKLGKPATQITEVEVKAFLAKK